MESFAPGNPHGTHPTSSAVCSPIIFSSVLPCLKLHLTLPFPFPSFVVPFWTSHHLLSIYFIHVRLSKLISILGGKPYEGKCFFPWVLGWGSPLFIVFFPALISTLTHTHTHTWYILTDGANNYLVKNTKHPSKTPPRIWPWSPSSHFPQCSQYDLGKMQNLW